MSLADRRRCHAELRCYGFNASLSVVFVSIRQDDLLIPLGQLLHGPFDLVQYLRQVVRGRIVGIGKLDLVVHAGLIGRAVVVRFPVEHPSAAALFPLVFVPPSDDAVVLDGLAFCSNV